MVFNNVHLQHQKASVILWTKTCHFHKAFLCFYAIKASIGTLWITRKLLLNKSETQNFSIMSIYNTIKLVFFHFKSIEYSVLQPNFSHFLSHIFFGLDFHFYVIFLLIGIGQLDNDV